jgi:hypothetical protein
LCIWGPPSITELSYKLVMIEGTLCGVAARNTEIEEDTYQIEQLQITNSEVIPHGVRCEGLSGPVMDELSNHYEGASAYTRSQLKEEIYEMTRLRLSTLCSRY